MVKVKDAFNMPCEEAREYLAEIIEHLDELDESDYFGREGWRRMIMKED